MRGQEHNKGHLTDLNVKIEAEVVKEFMKMCIHIAVVFVHSEEFVLIRSCRCLPQALNVTHEILNRRNINALVHNGTHVRRVNFAVM